MRVLAILDFFHAKVLFFFLSWPSDYAKKTKGQQMKKNRVQFQKDNILYFIKRLEY
jgi:hypothetical protein